MNRKLYLLPMLSVFLVGCNGQNSPFDGDTYVAKGMAPTHKIIRAMTSEEQTLYEDSRIVSDVKITSLTDISEERVLPKKALPSHVTATTYDERSTMSMAFKRYENNAQVVNLEFISQYLYTGSIVTNISSLDYYVVVNDDETELTITADVTSTSGVRTVGATTSAYDPATDYESTFSITLETTVWDKIGSCVMGVTADGHIGAVDITTATTPLIEAYIAGDGSRYIIETNTIFEAYLSKGVDDDTDEEFYYVSYVRSYEEKLIISEAIPNIATEAIVYRDKPILLSFIEEVIVADIATNGNFVTSQVPEVTA